MSVLVCMYYSQFFFLSLLQCWGNFKQFLTCSFRSVLNLFRVRFGSLSSMGSLLKDSDAPVEKVFILLSVFPLWEIRIPLFLLLSGGLIILKRLLKPVNAPPVNDLFVKFRVTVSYISQDGIHYFYLVTGTALKGLQ